MYMSAQGTYAVTRTDACKTCEKGLYQSLTKSTACKSCAAGAMTQNVSFILQSPHTSSDHIHFRSHTLCRPPHHVYEVYMILFRMTSTCTDMSCKNCTAGTMTQNV